MKKLFSLFLAAIFLVSSFHLIAFAIEKGDADGNGTISAVDARLILQYVAGIKSEDELQNIDVTDMNADAVITALDARIILQIVAGLVDAPTHTHTFSDATCTSPATCSCGETNGSALGHSYSEATCTSPEECTRCSAINGEALGHSYSNATCTSPEECTRCGAIGNSALGHLWNDATCSNPKTCSRCNETEGSTIPHNFVEVSSTDGNNVGSIITYQCSLCDETKTEEVQPLSLNVYRSGMVSISGWLSQVSYTANASGGCGKYEYKFEVYTTETSTSPALVEDFSENNVFGWTSRYYCNGNMLIVTVRDEAGNEATEKIVVD